LFWIQSQKSEDVATGAKKTGCPELEQEPEI